MTSTSPELMTSSTKRRYVALLRARSPETSVAIAIPFEPPTGPAGPAGRLCLGRFRRCCRHHRADRRQEAEHVELAPALDDLAVDDPVDADRLDADLLARRRRAHELAEVGAFPGEPDDHGIPEGHDVVDP